MTVQGGSVPPGGTTEGAAMMRRGIILAVLVAVLSGLTFAAPAPAQDEVTFLPGPWIAQVFFRGAIGDELGGAAVSGSNIFFTVTISEEGKVIAGEMTVDILFSGAIGDVTSKARYTGTLLMSGTASRLLAAGTLHIDQTTSDGEITIPIARDQDTAWEFSPNSATCSQVRGELFEGGREIQEAAGFQTTISSKFRALPDFSDELKGRLEALDAKVHAALVGEVTPEAMLDLVREVEAIRAEVALLEDCKKKLPKGFKPGGSEDAWLEGILITLLSKALETPGAYDAHELVSLLNSGVRGGAVGASSSDPEAAGQLLNDFDDALSVALGAAIAASDAAAIQDIYVAALQYGLTDLAAEAKAAL
jgi:hypothetical protein